MSGKAGRGTMHVVIYYSLFAMIALALTACAFGYKRALRRTTAIRNAPLSDAAVMAMLWYPAFDWNFARFQHFFRSHGHPQYSDERLRVELRRMVETGMLQKIGEKHIVPPDTKFAFK